MPAMLKYDTFHLFSDGDDAEWLKRQNNNMETIQNFWFRFSVTPIQFQCFEFGQA